MGTDQNVETLKAITKEHIIMVMGNEYVETLKAITVRVSLRCAGLLADQAEERGLSQGAHLESLVFAFRDGGLKVAGGGRGAQPTPATPDEASQQLLGVVRRFVDANLAKRSVDEHITRRAFEHIVAHHQALYDAAVTPADPAERREDRVWLLHRRIGRLVRLTVSVKTGAQVTLPAHSPLPIRSYSLLPGPYKY